MPKLTEEQIVQAFKSCFTDNETTCDECPAFDGKCNATSDFLISQILNIIDCLKAKNKELDEKNVIQRGLIDRLKAEIERLKKKTEEYPFKCKVGSNSEIHSKSIEDYDRLIEDISAEAYKEFAESFGIAIDERLSDEIKSQNPHLYLLKTLIKDVLKELVGEG